MIVIFTVENKSGDTIPTYIFYFIKYYLQYLKYKNVFVFFVFYFGSYNFFLYLTDLNACFLFLFFYAHIFCILWILDIMYLKKRIFIKLW